MKPTLSFLPKDRGSWSVWGALVGLILLGVVLAMGPIRSAFVKLDEAVVSQEKKLARNLGVLAPKTKEIVEKEYSRYGSVIKIKGSSEEENAMMLSEIDQLAGQNKVTLSATKPRDTKKDRDYEFYAVEVEIEANMAQLVGFVYALETSPQLLRVDRLAVDTKGGATPDSIRGTLVISKVVTL